MRRFEQNPNSRGNNRRDFLLATGATGVALALSRTARAAEEKPAAAAAEKPAEKAVGFTLPALPYAYDALEPHIDAETMKIHHDKHHQAYITNLNKALDGKPEWQGKSLETLLTSLEKLPEDIRLAVRNNAGGHANHTLFWEIMGPKQGGEPKGKLAEAITASFGSFADFKTKLGEAGTKRFGSGWAWLSVAKGKLVLSSTANQDTPVSEGATPILGLDVWEHAYYLKYRNVRADYITAWWNVVNWDAVSDKYAAAMKG